MAKSDKIKKLAFASILIALDVVLTYISNYIITGNVNINIALVTIVVGACMYGPFTGFVLGLINGLITLFAPATQAWFFPISPLATIFLCLLKTSLAGLVAGIIYKMINKKNSFLAVILSSISVPIINTGIFIIGVVLFFMDIYGNFTALIVGVLNVNFIIEFIMMAVLIPAIYRILNVIMNKNQE